MFKKFPSLMLARAYSVKIGVIFGVRFERRKVDKKENLHEN